MKGESVMITERKFKNAIKSYNDLMYKLGCEHNTIGTHDSEETEKWNLADMVQEAEYILSCYYEEGHCRYLDLHSLDDYTLTGEDLLDKRKFSQYHNMLRVVQNAKQEMKDLQMFIRKYKKDSLQYKATSNH